MACYQEKPTPFREYTLYDIGAFPEPPICQGITWRVKHPEKEPKDDEERRQVNKFQALQAMIRKRLHQKTLRKE
jgi:hypothetical protein